MIIGKLIPAGTGMPMYRNIKTEAPEYEPLPFYTSEVEEEMDLATWLREASSNRKEEVDSAEAVGTEAAPFAVVEPDSSAVGDTADLGGEGQGDVAAGD